MSETKKDFYEKFIAEYKITPAQNSISIIQNVEGNNVEVAVPIFEPTPENDLKINYYSLHGVRQTYSKVRSTIHQEDRTHHTFFHLNFSRTRFNAENEKKNGKKYHQPAKSGTHIFHTPGIIEKYRDSKKIETLVLVEGEKKAFKAWMEGLDVCGIAGIHQALFKNSQNKKQLHDDIVDLITKCEVRNIILLFDADVFKVEYKANDDLAARIYSFYSAVVSFAECCRGVVEKLHEFGINIYFSFGKNQALKGLDDLLINSQKPQEILTDLLKLGNCLDFFESISLDVSANKIKQFFHIDSVNSFWETYQSVIGSKEFRYHKNTYKHNPEANTCEMLKEAVVDNFIRVGTNYFLISQDAKGDEGILTQKLIPWKKETISDDHGKHILQHITKYAAFDNVPMHVDYKRDLEIYFPSGDVGRKYNKYEPLQHLPMKGECECSLLMVKHIFGEDYYNFGLDWIQLLYQRPTQKLPIICLYSKETGTGKSTFINWMKEIFCENMSLIGNSDFEDKFNAGWVTKLCVANEETSLTDKQMIKEKLKNLCTAQHVQYRDMGVSGVNIPCHLHFILATNNLNFINLEKNERRWAVMKLKPLMETMGKDDPEFLTKLIDEIPAFLHYLNERTLHQKQSETNLYFPAKSYITAAMLEVSNATRTKIEKDILQFIKDEFIRYCSVVDEENNVIDNCRAIAEIFITKEKLLNEVNKRVERNKTHDAVTITACLRDRMGKLPCANGSYPNYLHRMDRENKNWENEHEKVRGTPYQFLIEDVFTENEMWENFEPIEIEFIEKLKAERKPVTFKNMGKPKEEPLPF